MACTDIEQNLFIKCNSCNKQMSNTKHTISYCTKCNSTNHTSCLTESYCTPCTKITDDNSYIPAKNEYFNPFPDDDDCENNAYFDEDIDDATDTFTCARNILHRCTYHKNNYNAFSEVTKLTSFYFNNIDGFKSNFYEFRNQCLNFNHNFDFYCFNETNIKEGESHDYNLNNYNCEMLYCYIV